MWAAATYPNPSLQGAHGAVAKQEQEGQGGGEQVKEIGKENQEGNFERPL